MPPHARPLMQLSSVLVMLGPDAIDPELFDAVERWCARERRDRTMVRFEGAYGDVPLEEYEYKTYR